MSQDFRIARQQATDGTPALALSGRLDAQALASGVAQVSDFIASQRPDALLLDLEGLTYLDTAGALALELMAKKAAEAGCQLSWHGASKRVQGILDLIDPKALTARPILATERRLGMVEQIGVSAAAMGQDFYHMVCFAGDFIYALGQAMVHPRLLRWNDVLVYMEKVGVSGLPIVGLISFLLGLIIAFMSSLQLASFGANIYVASLVALGMVRELGPIMTAIIVAGRSGSAFAAEIGTMKVNQEVDALIVMGYDPVTFLTLPKVIAAVAMVPLLTLYSDCLAIFGGLLVGVLMLDLTPYAYLDKTMEALSVFDIIAGTFKAMFFALIISGIGCQRGMMVRGGALAVGNATTSAVVASMFWIIVSDSFFAILLHYLR